MRCVERGKKVVVLGEEKVLFYGVEIWLLAEAKGEEQ